MRCENYDSPSFTRCSIPSPKRCVLLDSMNVMLAGFQETIKGWSNSSHLPPETALNPCSRALDIFALEFLLYEDRKNSFVNSSTWSYSKLAFSTISAARSTASMRSENSLFREFWRSTSRYCILSTLHETDLIVGNRDHMLLKWIHAYVSPLLLFLSRLWPYNYTYESYTTCYHTALLTQTITAHRTVQPKHLHLIFSHLKKYLFAAQSQAWSSNISRKGPLCRLEHFISL